MKVDGKNSGIAMSASATGAGETSPELQAHFVREKSCVLGQ